MVQRAVRSCFCFRSNQTSIVTSDVFAYAYIFEPMLHNIEKVEKWLEQIFFRPISAKYLAVNTIRSCLYHHNNHKSLVTAIYYLLILHIRIHTTLCESLRKKSWSRCFLQIDFGHICGFKAVRSCLYHHSYQMSLVTLSINLLILHTRTLATIY